LKGIRIAILAVVLLLGLSTPGVSSKNNSLAVEYKFDFATVDGQWVIEDTFLREVPGEPLIPYYPAQILLPQDTEVKHIQVNHSNPIIEKGIEIPWGQPPCMFSDTPVTVGRNEKIYNSNQWYPEDIYEIASTESFRGFQILNINLYPLQYKPKSQTVKFYPKLSIYVQVDKSVKNELYRGLKCDKEAVRAMVDNPEVTETYAEEGSISASTLLPPETHVYVIITNSTLTPVFQTLADHKDYYLSSPTEIVDVEWIYSNYQGYDDQEKIRNFIADAFTIWGTSYCLLGGDVSVVPYRGFYASADEQADPDIAADMYYGCLGGNFDADGDHIYGEIDDGVDWLEEVFIGRAPVDTVEEAQVFVDKVTNHELAEKPKVCQFHQSRIQPNNNPDSRQLAWDCESWIPSDYEKRELFEENDPISMIDWIVAWAGDPLLFQHMGEGDTDWHYINSDVVWTNSDVLNLTNTDFWPVHMSPAGFCGAFEAEDCLAEMYVKTNVGAIATMMNSSQGWFSPTDASMYSGDFIETMFRGLFHDEEEHLGELLNQAKSYWISSAQTNPVYRWCYYEINLIGDPETPTLTKRPEGFVNITNPTNGEKVYGIVDITVSTKRCIDTVEFYIDNMDEPVYTDSSDPFSYSWDTASHPEDNNVTILVKGYCGDNFADEDTVTVAVDNYYIKILNPSDGEIVFETVTITTETRGITDVEFYIDNMDEPVYTDKTAPFQYDHWDTCPYTNGSHTIRVEGYCSGILKDFDQITCNVSNDSSILITNPSDGEEVFGTVTITTDTSCIDTVEFYINGVLQHTDDAPLFRYNWNTTTYTEDEECTIHIKGYFLEELKDEDTITVTVNNYYVTITNPSEGEDVFETVTITAETRGIDTVKFYVNGEQLCSDSSEPFDCLWNTTTYPEDERCTIHVEGYLLQELKDEDTITVTVNNYYATITNPSEREYVSGTVTVTTETKGINTVKFYIDGELVKNDDSDPFNYIWDTTQYSEENHTITIEGHNEFGVLCDEDSVTCRIDNAPGVDTVYFYIDGSFLHADTSAPFDYRWDTTAYQDGEHTITVRGYESGMLCDEDRVACYVDNSGECFGSLLVFLIVFFGSIGIMMKKRIKEHIYLHKAKIRLLKSRKTVIFTLAILLSSSVPADISENDNLTVDYAFEPVMADSCSQWTIKDTQILEMPGEPLVPYRAASILLPEGAVLKNVKVRHEEPIVQKGFDLPWGQPPCTFSDEPVTVGRSEATYGSMNWYPDKLFEVVSVESFRGFGILLVHLFPVQYQPKSGTVKFYEKLTVEVQFGKGMKNKLYRGLYGDKKDVAGIVDNPRVTSTYEDGGTPLQTEEYIIITSSTLTSTFQTLATWKAGFVNGASVYDTTYIYNNYTGVDNQEKIRNFIIDKYEHNGTKYVLLGGDTGVVPYRGFYIYSGGYVDYDMAADMYYGHLDGNWNDDGDSYWAEPGEEDWYAEVAVGRAPVDNSTEAQAFVDKVIAYEQMEKPDVGARKRVCFHESRVQSGNNPDARCLAWNCDDWIPGGYYIDYLFEEDGQVTKTKWINAWSAEPIVVVHIGHGNTDIYYINYEPTVSWYGSDVPSLTNAFYPWTTSVACISGQFEASDCLAEKYVKDDCGAIGAIYNDNYGWFSTLDACMYSGEFCEMEVRACWSDGYDSLGELRDRSRYYMASSASSNSTYRWCYYERNLMGDPETPCLTTRPGGPPPDTVTITSPINGAQVCGRVEITVSVTGCVDTVEFYIDETLKFTDYSLPYSYVWNSENGQVTIMVKGYCSGVLVSVDTITVTVNCYYVIITNPSEGEEVSGTVTITVDT